MEDKKRSRAEGEPGDDQDVRRARRGRRPGRARRAGHARRAQGGGGGLMARCDTRDTRAPGRERDARAETERHVRARKERRNGNKRPRTYADTAVDVSFVHTRNLHTRDHEEFLPSVYAGGFPVAAHRGTMSSQRPQWRRPAPAPPPGEGAFVLRGAGRRLHLVGGDELEAAAAAHELGQVVAALHSSRSAVSASTSGSSPPARTRRRRARARPP